MISWLFFSPNEKRSNTIGWVSSSFEILPAGEVLLDESKLISKNTDEELDTVLMVAISELSISTNPIAEEISPGSKIVTDVVPGNPPKCKVMLVSENELISSCFSNDLKSKFSQFVPAWFEELSSMNKVWSSPAVIPRFIEIFSKDVGLVAVVSITSIFEILSGTDDDTGVPPPRGAKDDE